MTHCKPYKDTFNRWGSYNILQEILRKQTPLQMKRTSKNVKSKIRNVRLSLSPFSKDALLICWNERITKAYNMLLDVFICFIPYNNDATLCKIIRCNRFSAGNISISSKYSSLHNMKFLPYIFKVIEIS